MEMTDYRLRNRVFTLENSIDELYKLAHNLHTSLQQALKDVEELKHRVGEDDCK